MLSFYGADTYSEYDNNWKHKINKLFYTKAIGNFKLDAGFGYDYEKSSNFFCNSDSSINDSLSTYTYDNYLFIKRLTYNTFYGNLNSVININTASSLLLGFDCSYTRIRGFSFRESYMRTYRTAPAYDDMIEYNHYCGNDYNYYHSAGLGLLKKYTSKTNQKKTSVIYAQWKFYRNHLLPKLGDTVPSVFQNIHPRSASFYGIDNTINRINLNYLVTNTLSDSIGIQYPLLFNLPWCQHAMDFLQLTISYGDSRYIDKYIDTDSITNFYGTIKRSSLQSLSFSLECMPKLFFIGKFYCNLYTFCAYSPPINDKYHSLELSLYPGIGTKFSLLNTFLLDFNICTGNIAFATDFYNGFDFWFMYPAIQLRIAVLR